MAIGEDNINCKNCGRELPSEPIRYCPHCGKDQTAYETKLKKNPFITALKVIAAIVLVLMMIGTFSFGSLVVAVSISEGESTMLIASAILFGIFVGAAFGFGKNGQIDKRYV